MHDVFTIYLDRLRNEGEKSIEETLSPTFLDLPEGDNIFVDPITLQGSVVVSQNSLIVHLSLTTFVLLPCSICNEKTKVPLVLENLYLTEQLDEIREEVYSIKEFVRESLLLEVPMNAECVGGCPERANLAKYFKKQDGQHLPFSNL